MPMRVKLIAAIDESRGIGKDNKLPWKLSHDLRFFSRTTRGSGNNAVLMGRHTWEAISSTPLPQRYNVVVSTTATIPDEHSQNAVVYSDPAAAVQHCRDMGFDELWIIGGAAIYDTFLNGELSGVVEKCVITQVAGTHECDAFFPECQQWTEAFVTADDTTGLVVKHLKRAS